MPPMTDRRRLVVATLGALLVAAAVLVLFVLPAEYGIDPTGVGTAIGLNILDAPPPEVPTDEPAAVTPAATYATYESRFVRTGVEATRADGVLAEGASIDVPFDITSSNVSRVTLEFAAEDANVTPDGRRTRPDLFEIALLRPDGAEAATALVRTEPDTSLAAHLLEAIERDVPPSRAIEATSAEEARAVFARNDPTDEAASGTWTARITLLDAGDADAADGIGLPADPFADEGNGWSIVVAVERYELEVDEKPGTRQRADTVVLEVPAGKDLEYKLALALGKRLDYSWTTQGGPLYVDFHGEKDGDASGGFTRHRNGNLATDAGTLVAPFDGRHGWYWRNDGDRDVTLTLVMRGQYDVIGVV